MPNIEYFYSTQSAFAYLGAKRLGEIAAASGRRVFHRPMDLGKVVEAVSPGGFRARSRAHRAYYFSREIERWAEFREVAFRAGIPANHGHDITLANTMLIAAQMRGEDVAALALAMMQAHWDDHADLADRTVLAGSAHAVGLEPEPLFEAAQTAEVKSIYEANTAEAIARSVFGSPSYFVEGDMFYGQDRLEMVERALDRPFANKWA